MRKTNRVITAITSVALLAVMPLSAAASEVEVSISADVVVESDQSTDAHTDRPADREVDKETDRPSDREVDKETDRPSDQVDETDEVRHRCLLTDNPRRCLHDRAHDFDIRHLIWRLIKAHDWEKLLRLFHWLGWI